MAMQTVQFKEHEGLVYPMAPLSLVPSVPWWNSNGSQSANYGESFGQLKPISTDPNSGNQLMPTKVVERGPVQGPEKGDTVQFTVFSGVCKSSANGQITQQLHSNSAQPEYQARLDLGFNQTMLHTKYPYLDPCYGLYSAYGPQITGRIMLLPLDMTNDDGPIYVNAKQYQGIIRRRQSRAKAEMGNKVIRKRKPYLHKSRHLHAVRRARGCGGRFLKTRNLNNEKGETVDKNMCNGKFSQPTESHSSETPKSDSGNWKPSMVANGSRSNHSGSEVTSMFLRGNLSYFQTSHSHPSVHPLFDMKTTRHGIVIPSKWVAAANNRCDLKV